MSTKNHRLALLSILAGSVCCTAAAAADWWTWRQVAPGVVVALQPDAARFDDANVVFIDWGEDGLIMVDAPAKAEHLEELLERLSERTKRRVRWIVNTHWHADHTQGNGRVREAFPEAVIVGQRTLLHDVPERAAKQIRDRIARYEELLPEAKRQLALGRDEEGEDLDEDEIAVQTAGIGRAEAWLAAHRGVRFLVPEVVVSNRLTLHDGGRVIELIAVQAHTRGDLVIHLPDRRVLITGDVLDDLPYVGHGYPRSWVGTLDELAALEPRFVIPGHGPVFDGLEQLHTVRGFLVDLIAQVEVVLQQEGGDSDLEAEDLVERVDVSTWRDRLVRDATSERFFDAVLSEAIARVGEDLRGGLEIEVEE